MGFFDKIKKAFINEKKQTEQETNNIETDQQLGENQQSEQKRSVETRENQRRNQANESEQTTNTENKDEAVAIEKPMENVEGNLERPHSIQVSEQILVTEQPAAPQEEKSNHINTPNSASLDTSLETEPTIAASQVMMPEVNEQQLQKKYETGLEKTRKTFGQRLNTLFANFRTVDEEFFEELEETLIGADVGFEVALKITDELRQEVKLRNAKKTAAIQNTIIEKMVDLYEAEGLEEISELNIQSKGLTVMLFVGVNGVGKTTSIGKLAYEYKEKGQRVLLAAADTFRAGAIDQLVVWGERAGVEVVRGKEGGDPAAVVFDAIEKAKLEKADILLVDTAGRLQNKVNLMKELEKINRVIQREIPEAPHEVLLVVDATTGQNALSQAKQFKETTNVTGLILTKLDGTAKGGIVLAIRSELHLPVKLVGLGEGIHDLEPFNSKDFAFGLFKGLLKEE